MLILTFTFLTLAILVQSSRISDAQERIEQTEKDITNLNNRIKHIEASLAAVHSQL